MDAIESLQKLLESVNSGSLAELTLSPEQIQEYFEKLVLVASQPAGYDSLCWEVGDWLLIISDNRASEFFNEFGYKAIGIAIASAIKRQDLPKGLGWHSKPFYLGDSPHNVMYSVLTHPRVQDEIDKVQATHELVLNLDTLDPMDVKTANTVALFLAHIHLAGFDPQIQLMWGARLFDHLHPDNPARDQAARLVLDGLVRQGRFVNAFYWLKCFYEGRGTDVKDTIDKVMLNILHLIRDKGRSGDAVLASLSYDVNLEALLVSSDSGLILLLFATVWVFFFRGQTVRRDFIDNCVDRLWNLDCSTLALFISRISIWALQLPHRLDENEAAPCPIKYLSAPQDSEQALQLLKAEFSHAPNYRGKQQPVDLWNECREAVFAPLLVKLESVSSLAEVKQLQEQVNEMKPDRLIRRTRIYKASLHHHKLDDSSYRMLSNDFEKYLKFFRVLASASYRRLLLAPIADKITDVDWKKIVEECDKLASAYPVLEEALQYYFYDVLDAWEPILAGANAR